jgi:nitrite reductase/ring-hydroxylating ferredoxin subunit/alkylhydroperoxidase/carboxymuconolactone decarboxylase family protein YurZ
MSDALDYLVQARPEAMGHYFSFLKDAGKHLDPKTRNLISVITKVDAQTERGFRQYLKRALREGCTPMEIIDALLMAFPTLGLTKIVWATDIILAMKLPGFAPEALRGATPRWHDVMAVTGLDDGEVRRMDCEGRGLFVYREGQNHKVYDSICPHQSTDIPQLALQGLTLTCPKHEWAFDVKSGACISKGKTPLTQIESKVENGRLMARW